MREMLRIGAGAGFSGDRLEPAAVLAERGGIRYLVLECLGERTVALAQLRKRKDPTRGYDPLLERRRRRLRVPAGRSAWTAGWGAGGACGGCSVPVPRVRLRRRREGAAAAAAPASVCGGRAGAAARNTLAPTSPSAQSAPSVVCTSTRHTAIEVLAPPTGARFWVSVQRA